MARDPDVVEAERDSLAFKARFCLATGVQPSEFDAMTDDEVEAFIAELNRHNN